MGISVVVSVVNCVLLLVVECVERLSAVMTSSKAKLGLRVETRIFPLCRIPFRIQMRDLTRQNIWENLKVIAPLSAFERRKARESAGKRR